MGRRILAAWLPRLPTDRLRRRQRLPIGAPLATVAGVRGRLVLAAVDARAADGGLRPGMTLADARAVAPGLLAAAAEPAADARALDALAAACGRYTPWTAAQAPDGLLLDITGAAHLLGGEVPLLGDLVGRLGRLGYAARAAIADTAGAAWAVARVGPGLERPGGDAGAAVVAPGAAKPALAGLPVLGLRLEAGTVEGLERFGLRRIGDLYDLPRAALTRRFGGVVARRLDQALGALDEPISPRPPKVPHAERLAFAEPIGRTEDVEAALCRLLGRLCAGLERAQQGLRRAELSLDRVDGGAVCLAVGTSRPTRRPDHLHRLFRGKLDGLDAGLGIEAMALTAPVVEPLGAVQAALGPQGRSPAGPGGSEALAELLDRLGNRGRLAGLGRAVPRQSHLPERAVALQPPLAPLPGGSWPPDRPRPLRLLPRPQPVEVTAPVPDDPPLLFRWQGEVYRVARAEGPERIEPEWWLAELTPGHRRDLRDYYLVEDTEGRRFWLYRAGAYDAAVPARWFLHGLLG